MNYALTQFGRADDLVGRACWSFQRCLRFAFGSFRHCQPKHLVSQVSCQLACLKEEELLLTLSESKQEAFHRCGGLTGTIIDSFMLLRASGPVARGALVAIPSWPSATSLAELNISTLIPGSLPC